MGGEEADVLEVVAAIDQGTQSTRVYLFDREARPVAWHQVPLPQIYPQAGWCEHDPEEIWRSVVECLARALENAERQLQQQQQQQPSPAAAAAAKQKQPKRVRVAAVGLTNQRETALAWDRATGRPLHRAVVWHDLRTSAICEGWEARLPGGRDHFRPVCGLPVSTYFSAPKWVWMRDNSRAVRDALAAGTACLGTVDSWLIYKLTGGQEHVTDVTNAARTMLLDLKTRDWHLPTLELLGIPRAALPSVRSNSEPYGRVACGGGTGGGTGDGGGSRRASGSGGGGPAPSHFFGDEMFAFAVAGLPLSPSSASLLSEAGAAAVDEAAAAGAVAALAARTRAAYAGVPVAGSLGDQMAALLGQRCGPGEAKNTYGTGCFMLLNTGPGRPAASGHGLLTTVGFQLGPESAPHYALEGSVAVAGRGVSWLKDNLGLITSADESEALAASVPDSGGVYFVPAFSGLLAPRWDDTARGAILGLTGHTTRAHVVRAMLEAVCFQTREVLEAMRADVLDAAATGTGTGAAGAGADGAALSVLRVDGGAATNALLMQLQADVLQVAVERPAFLETTALGAALAAGLAVGFYAREFVEPWAAAAGKGGAAAAAKGGEGDGGGRRVFLPSVSPEEAARRYAHWNKAVSRSVGLADLAT